MVLVLAILGFALIGFVVVVRAIFGKKKVPPLEPGATLGRRERLAIVEEVLGADMPPELAEELRRWRLGLVGSIGRAPEAVANAPEEATDAHLDGPDAAAPQPAILTAPADAPLTGGPDLVGLAAEPAAAGGLEPEQEAPPIPPRNHALAVGDSRSDDEDQDLGDAGLADGFSVPGGTLEVSPDMARLAQRARPGLGAFLSFENIIFLLSAVLILGGSLYFAAVTWSRVPGTWQYLFVELITAFYGALMLVGARILIRRLKLDSAARTLVAIASGVSLLCAAMGAAAFFQSGVAGLIGTLVAAGFALACGSALLRLLDLPVERSPFFAASAALLTLAGGAQVLGSGPGAGLAVLLASGLAVMLFVPRDRELQPLHGVIAAAVPVVGLLLAAPGEIALAHTAPALAVLAWLSVEVRARGHRWIPLPAVLLVGLAMILSLSSLGAVAVTALVGVAVLWRAAEPPVAVDDTKLDGFSLLAGIAAGLLWVYLSVAWAPSIGLLMSREAIDWLVDLVTSPGEQVSASWDGLAALPVLALALWESARRRRVQGDRARAIVAELSGFGVFVVGSGLTMATFERQPVPSGIILLLLAGAWGFWSFRRHSALRLAAAHIVLLLGLLSLGSSISDFWAALLPGLAAMAMAAAPSRSARSVACLAAPGFALALVADGHSHQVWPTIILVVTGVLALWQPGLERRTVVRAFGPPLLLLGWLVLLLMDPSGSAKPLLDDDLVLAAMAVFVLACAVVVATWRGPRFLTIETNIAALGLAFIGTAIAMDHGPGYDETAINGGAAIVALLALLLTPRGADRRWLGLNWLITAFALPIAVAPLFEAEVAWPGAVAASAGTVALLLWSRRERAAWLGGFAFVEWLVAALWWTLLVATFFSTGGGEERVLTVLGIVATGVGGGIAVVGQRLSAAGPGLVRGFSVTYLLFALGLGLIGMTAVDHPKGVDVVMALVNLGGIAGFSWFLATRHRSGWLIYLTEAAVVGLYGYLRLRTDLLDGLAGYDGVVLVAGALAFTGVSRLLEDARAELGARQSRHLAAVLPLVVPFVSEWDGSFSDSLGMGLVSAQYALLARLGGGQRYAWLAALALNALLFPIWIRHSVETPMAYLMPVGMTLMVMARLYREALRAAAPVLRTLAALIVLGSTSLESFSFDTLLPAVLLGALSVGAVLLGIAWRQRAYLYMGFAFLLLDIAVNLTHWGMSSRLIAGTLGVVAGVALFALGVSVARHKEELLSRYRRVQEWEW
ncbi:MAG: hypothetical protein ABIJ09_12010 [Pseudomonadota bacterium]